MPGILSRVLLESDKACQGGYETSDTADIYTEQEMLIIVCKLRKQYRGGDVADKLAGKRGKYESVLAQKEREEIAHGVDPRHISGENKEENKRKEQSVIHLQERSPVEY